MDTLKGKFIVIDGTDGSGKATQAEFLANRLRAAGFGVEVADFPQYNTKSAGAVEEYLGGKYGEADAVGPYRASIFYAVDRYDASFKIREWLDQGKIVISNRYVTANMGHQGGKIESALERKAFFDWLGKLEFGLFGIPKPDLNIILHVAAEISQKLSQQRTKEDWVGKTTDIHQASLEHLKKAERVYLEIAKTFPDFTLIECVSGGEIMAREDIAQMVWEAAVKLIGIPAVKHAPDFKTLHEQYENNRTAAAGSGLKVEKISAHAKLPARGFAGDAGLDLFSADYYSILPGQKMVIHTGIKIAVPEGCAGLIWDKSGVARDGIHAVGGVIDAGYRGEIMITLINLSQDIYHIAPSQKVAQLLIQRVELPEIVEEKIDNDTARGEGGFGSTGKF